MDKVRYNVYVERCPEMPKFWVVDVPDLPGCHTQGRSIKEVAIMAHDAVELVREWEGIKGEYDLTFIVKTFGKDMLKKKRNK